MNNSYTHCPLAKVAYFSMEVGLHDNLPTYSGGLGVLAGDTIKAAADLGVPMVAVTLLHRKGYFKQSINNELGQSEAEVAWQPEKFLTKLDQTVQVQIANRKVSLAIWSYDIKGVTGKIVPVLFLDSSSLDNSEFDQQLTNHLYGGDNHYRLCQEIVLGIGGVRALKALGFNNVEKYHMNEGHAALLTLELLAEQQKLSKSKVNEQVVMAVQKKCVFTTHTPVPAGHDRFTVDHVSENLGDIFKDWSDDEFCNKLKEKLFEEAYSQTFLNMTHLALNFSSYVNGVAIRHAEVSRQMFKGYTIDAITNGIHANTWASVSMSELFDRDLQGWRSDNYLLRNAHKIKSQELWLAHQAAKKELVTTVAKHGADFSLDTFTIGFARRFATYKRADLIFDQPERLNALADKYNGLQLVFSGKAHPKDNGGKDLILKILNSHKNLSSKVKVVFLPNYNMQLGGLITAGVDLWLNNPRRPLEASGTSGMKAALNGVPNLSILDGWWIEGWIEGVTGWSIGSDTFTKLDLAMTDDEDRTSDANAMYEKLEQIILPMYHENRAAYLGIMQNAIALCGSYFHTQRMVNEYVMKGYF